MTTISLYIATLNPLFWQATIEQTIRHALLFSDEIIVVDGGSTDGTIELIKQLQEEDQRIKLYIYKDKYELGQASLADKKSFALSKCTSDYAILSDDDECIHEKYAEVIRQLPDEHPEAIAFRFNTLHFYRSWDHYQKGRGDWYKKKIYMVENISPIHHGKVNRDRDNFLFDDVPLDSLSGVIDTDVTVYHYGWCKNDAVLLLKKYFKEISWWSQEYWELHKFPFRFDNPETLPQFEGEHPRFMKPIIEKTFNCRWVKQFNIDYEEFPWSYDPPNK